MNSITISTYAFALVFGIAGAASAQQQGNMQNMPGMDHSRMQGMDHSNMQGMQGMDHSNMAGMDHSNMPGMQGNGSGGRTAAPIKPSRPAASTQQQRSN